MHKVIYVIAFMLLLSHLAACDSEMEKRTHVGGIDFCVPKESRLKIDIWWIPKSLPEGGFSFVLPIPVNNGGVSEIVGDVAEASTYPSWKRKPAPDSQWWKELSVREGRRLVADGRYIAAASLNDYSYLVWHSGQEPPSIGDEYTDKSEVIANCLVPQPNSKRVTCDRVVHLNSVAVHYTYEVNLINRIDWLDKQVVSAVNDWQCSKLH